MELNPEQTQVVYASEPHVAVLAGAGSGKTTVLTDNIKERVKSGVSPDKIACITFTTAAAAHMQTKLGDVVLGFIGTIHALCLRIVQEMGGEIGYGQDITVLDEEGAAQFLKEQHLKLHGKFSLKELEAELQKGPLRFYTASSQRRTQIEIAAANIYANMVRNNIITFDAIIQFAVVILTNHPDALTPTDIYWDEFQDTGNDDAKFLQCLAGKNIFLVGDPRQSIYGFRGANVANFNHLLASSSYRRYEMTLNYRCGRRIVRAANALMSKAKISTPPMVSPGNQAQGEIECWHAANEHEEFQRILKCIHQCQAEGIALSQIAILCRSNAVRESILKKLEQTEINVNKEKRTYTPKALLAALSFLANPENDFAARTWLKAHCEITNESYDGKIWKASQAARSINDFHYKMPHKIDLANVTTQLAQWGFGARETYSVHEKVKRLRRDATVNDLIGSFREYDQDEEGNGITICTIHRAKGREWQAVILPAFTQDELPSNSLDRDKEEERRIAFVAVTRAINRLYIIATRRRFKYRVIDSPPSQFVDEMGLEFQNAELTP